jgi:hypothetical protein
VRYSAALHPSRELSAKLWSSPEYHQTEEFNMKYALILATIAALATPALADDVRVGVGVGPVGAGVTVGAGHRDYDRDRERTTVIKEREPAERTTIIKKEHVDDNVRTKTIIKDRD